jgi:hypothetical protein
LETLVGKSSLQSGLEWAAIGVLALAAYWFFSPAPAPTLQEYVKEAQQRKGGHVALNKSGTINLDGFAVNCQNTPLVYDDNFGDHAAAWPSSHFIIINQKYFAALPKTQKLFTFYHECGHIAGHKSELEADCYGIRQGVKLGWLDQAGLDQLCAYWRPKKGDAAHPPGKVRCARMIACFNEKE